MKECIEIEHSDDYKRGWIEGTNLKLPCGKCVWFTDKEGYCIHPKVSNKGVPLLIKFVGCGWMEK